MRHLIICALCFFLFSEIGHALEFQLNLWQRSPCSLATQDCLPHALYDLEKFHMVEPLDNTTRRLKIHKPPYEIVLLWTKRNAEGGYYSFQMELFDELGNLISQCTRYEGIESFETAPVGSCSGTDHTLGKIIGVSIYLP